jgi:hypothetical protein
MDRAVERGLERRDSRPIPHIGIDGGGLAAIPVYLAEVFGTGSLGTIHGRLLTAWSVAGILGPAGGTSHRLKPGPATVRALSRRPGGNAAETGATI